ncbi:hypothetical protein K443DRAFT_597100 [Laccaria amethystina LaAM-08-1]|uniref:Unplaced genomic scaffold K443scaffold_847, whole genome shotgun sequence n=1 Tax=Laccaria amethystina LaAM-08-1 TaxID=1095629 RepID=A0A0C9WGR3_9AGAR|nr:hypothetical protein K443DRAFT_597100 [Laccaria amethystina LaAM-08-1]
MNYNLPIQRPFQYFCRSCSSPRRLHTLHPSGSASRRQLTLSLTLNFDFCPSRGRCLLTKLTSFPYSLP